MEASDGRAEVRRVDLDAEGAAAAAKDSRLEKLREDRLSKPETPRRITFGQLLTAAQHKAHIAEHYERCKAQGLELGGRVGGSKELELSLTGHGFKLSEVAATDVNGDGRVLKTTLHVEESRAQEWERPWELARAKVCYTLWLEPECGGVPSQQLTSTSGGGSGSGTAAPVEIWVDEPPVPAAGQSETEAGLPEGLEAALKTMRRGETARVSIRPNAKPPPANRPRAGSSSTAAGFPEGHAHCGKALVAEVTLVNFENPGSVMMMSADEELEKAAECKHLGNQRFKRGDYARALRRYKRALELLEYDEKRNFVGWEAEQKALQAKERVSVLNNLAMVQFKLGDYDESRKMCGRVLAAEPGNAKAKYRRAAAHLAMGGEHIADSIDELRGVLALEPTNNQAKKELAKAKKALKVAAPLHFYVATPSLCVSVSVLPTYGAAQDYKETPEAKEAQARGMSSGLKNMFDRPSSAKAEAATAPLAGTESSELISATEKLAQLEAAEAAKKKKQGSGGGGGSSKKSPKKTGNTKAQAQSSAAELRKLHEDMPADVNALLAKMAGEAGIDINRLPELMAGYDQKHAGGLRAQAEGGGLGKDMQGLDSLEAELDALEAQLGS